MNVAPSDPHRFLKLVSLPLVALFCVANYCNAAGTVIAWGNNNDLQSQIPPGLISATKVAAGALHSIALKSDSTVVSWGSDSFGQTNTPANLSNVVAISAGATFSLALKNDGSVVQWGSLLTGAPGITDGTAIAAGWDHALALKADGTVLVW